MYCPWNFGSYASEKLMLFALQWPYQTKADPDGLDDATLPAKSMDVSEVAASEDVSLKTYLKSIVFMPKAMQILCLTNFFCWGSLVCYGLNFTDFVGQAVFGGSPRAKGEP